MSSYRSQSADLYFWDKEAGERYARILRENTGRQQAAGLLPATRRRARTEPTPAERYVLTLRHAAVLFYAAAIFVLSYLAF